MSLFVKQMVEDESNEVEVTEERLDKIFAQFDTDGDGLISQDEMLAFIKDVTGL